MTYSLTPLWDPGHTTLRPPNCHHTSTTDYLCSHVLALNISSLHKVLIFRYRKHKIKRTLQYTHPQERLRGHFAQTLTLRKHALIPLVGFIVHMKEVRPLVYYPTLNKEYPINLTLIFLLLGRIRLRSLQG